MKSQKINMLKVVRIDKFKTRKWQEEQVYKNEKLFHDDA